MEAKYRNNPSKKRKLSFPYNFFHPHLVTYYVRNMKQTNECEELPTDLRETHKITYLRAASVL